MAQFFPGAEPDLVYWSMAPSSFFRYAKAFSSSPPKIRIKVVNTLYAVPEVLGFAIRTRLANSGFSRSSQVLGIESPSSFARSVFMAKAMGPTYRPIQKRSGSRYFAGMFSASREL